MKKTKQKLVISIGVILICLACFFIGRISSSTGDNQQMSAVVLENRLTKISELATITYSYTNMAEFENSKDFYGMTLPFTTKSFILTYDGQIKAGVNLAKAEVSVSGNKITVILPDAEILSHEMDEESIEVFDETTSIFNSFKIEDYKAFCVDQKKEMATKATEKGLLTEAHEKAIKSVKQLISQVSDQDYTIEVK